MSPSDDDVSTTGCGCEVSRAYDIVDLLDHADDDRGQSDGPIMAMAWRAADTILDRQR